MGLKQSYFSIYNQRNRKSAIATLADKTGMRIIFPFYHVVSDVPVQHINYLYNVKTTEQFIADLNFLLENYLPLAIDDYQNGNYNPDKNYFVLSFDDGLSQMAHVVQPILKSLSVPAVFFLNSAFIDNKVLFYRYKVALLLAEIEHTTLAKQISSVLSLSKIKIADPVKYLLQLKYKDTNLIDSIAQSCNYNFDDYLQKVQPYLSTTQIFDLIKDGHTIGAHSVDHPLYGDINPQVQFVQTRDSMRVISEKFNLPNNYFAFPFTADGVVKELFPAMYGELNIQKSFGTAGLQKNKINNHIERIPAEHQTYDLESLVKNEYHYFQFKKLFGK